jgi:hypothetical protein
MIQCALKLILLIWMILFGVFAFLMAHHESQERRKNRKQ